MVKIAPSLLAADFSALGQELARVSQADMLHIDVMDGCFVPNISIGPPVVKAIRDKTPLFFDVHLMLQHPLPYIEAFRAAGADSISFHIECGDDPMAVIARIRELGMKPGIALSPATPPEALREIDPGLYLITVMTVEPGFGGQKLIESCLDKLPTLRNMFPRTLLEIDGGVNLTTAPLCLEKGADILVAGTAVFRAEDPGKAIQALRDAAEGKDAVTS